MKIYNSVERIYTNVSQKDIHIGEYIQFIELFFYVDNHSLKSLLVTDEKIKICEQTNIPFPKVFTKNGK